ncbi:hypothetical protein AcV5_008469 [Taiwanofungus camphoratus]|nr:hypothetical protein AcV5_008469 [Antrodia cinnamomea]
MFSSKKPWNAEPDIAKLVEHCHTPEELVYCRNHCPVKALDPNKFVVRIDGLVEHEQEYTLNDLRKQFERTTVVAALQCAGNRRKKMAEKKHKDVEGLLWEEGTICNCKWAGVSMRELLRRAGAPEFGSKPDKTRSTAQNLHLCFASHVTACQNDAWFGASIPLEKAMDENGDVLLAYEASTRMLNARLIPLSSFEPQMNGRPLSPDHGYPLRAVVPGYSGVRWVKWVDRIAVTQRESPNFYQQKDYKVLPVKVQTHEMADSESWWSRIPPLQANPLNSAIATIKFAPPAFLHVKGYAVRGPSGQVAKVEVSVNEGRTWEPAMITYQEGSWSWTLWEARIDLGEMSGEKHGRIWSRATDESGETQQPDMDWNLRGVAYSAVGEKTF